VGLLRRLFKRADGEHEARGEDVTAHLRAAAATDPTLAPDQVRRRVRDVFFALQRSWIERNPSVAEGFLSPALADRQRMRIEGLIQQNRVHRLENPLIEDLDFVAFVPAADEIEPTVTARLWISMVETIRDSRSGKLVAGKPREKRLTTEYWTFERRDGMWLLADVEQDDEGRRHLSAPLVGDDFAHLSPEMALRERYARAEISMEEFESQMAELLRTDPIA
jgi:predicted lipid-binding transport protein (Tim44 family)